MNYPNGAKVRIIGNATTDYQTGVQHGFDIGTIGEVLYTKNLLLRVRKEIPGNLHLEQWVQQNFVELADAKYTVIATAERKDNATLIEPVKAA